MAVIRRKGDDAEMISKKALNRMIKHLKRKGWTAEEIVELLELMSE